MSLKTFVKISSVSNLSDARYCTGMMVDVLGFDIDPISSTQIPAGDYKEIVDWLAGVKFAGEFEDASKDNICNALSTYEIDYIQISDYDAVESINLLGKPIIFKLEISSKADLGDLKSKLAYLDELVEMVILKCDEESLFEELDAQIGYYNANIRLLKGYGLKELEVLHKFPGIEMEAEKEDRPGFKDYGEIMDVLEELDED